MDRELPDSCNLDQLALEASMGDSAAVSSCATQHVKDTKKSLCAPVRCENLGMREVTVQSREEHNARVRGRGGRAWV